MCFYFIFSDRIKRLLIRELKEASAMLMKRRESVHMARIANIAMVCWICEVRYLNLNLHLVACLDRREEMAMGIPYVRNYSFFFFNFPHISTLADAIKGGYFSIPTKHISKVNEALQKPDHHVYFFISVSKTNLIHVGDECVGLCDFEIMMNVGIV